MNPKLKITFIAPVLILFLATGTSVLADDRSEQARQWYQDGNRLFEQGDYPKAMELYEKVTDFMPKYPFSYVGMGNVMIKFRRYQEALISFQKAIQLKPDLNDAHINLAVVYNTLGLFEEAVDELEDALEINPNKPNTYKALGDAYQGIGDMDLAIQAYEKALSIHPRYPGAWIGLGDVYFDQKRYDLAANQYKKAITENSEDEMAFNSLIASYLKMSDFRSAKYVYRNLFLFNLQKKEYMRALQMLARIAETDFLRASHFLNSQLLNNFSSKDSGVSKEYSDLLLSANNQYDSGAYESALSGYIKTLRVKPDSEEALIRLGVCYSMLGVEDLAVESFQRVLDLNPDSEKAYIELGGSLQNLQKFKEAIAVYNKALSINPNSYDAYANLGFLYASLGQLGGAKSSFRKARDLLRAIDGDPVQIRLVSSWLNKLERVE